VFNTYFNRPSNGHAVQIPEIDTLFQRVRAELDDTKQEALWRQLGDLLFDSVQQVPLYWLPVEVMYNPRIVASYTFPGSTSGLYTKLETIKAASRDWSGSRMPALQRFACWPDGHPSL